jgi:hypothetical protein
LQNARSDHLIFLQGCDPILGMETFLAPFRLPELATWLKTCYSSAI